MGCHLSMNMMGFQVNMNMVFKSPLEYDWFSRFNMNLMGFCQHEYDGFSVHMNMMSVKSA